MKLKSLEEFLNESYSSKDTMTSLISKLSEEGKSVDVIYSFLCTLGVDPVRIKEELAKHGALQVESNINEEGDLADELEDLEDDLEKTQDEVEEKPESDKDEDDESNTEEKEDALKGAISDIEKLDKIKKILDENSDLSTEDN
tara:strand:- start:3691 stop:4119 length:429 start_codon:yes stop_codon:yes gene_type:complete